MRNIFIKYVGSMSKLTLKPISLECKFNQIAGWIHAQRWAQIEFRPRLEILLYTRRLQAGVVSYRLHTYSVRIRTEQLNNAIMGFHRW